MTTMILMTLFLVAENVPFDKESSTGCFGRNAPTNLPRFKLVLRLRGQEKFWRNLEVVRHFKYERLAQSALAS